MARSVEFLISPIMSRFGGPMLDALCHVSLRHGDRVSRTSAYVGHADWLVLWGVGALDRAPVRKAHMEKGGLVFCWDLAYFGRKRPDYYLRVSINHEHPQHLLTNTTQDSRRWDAHGLPLRDTYDPNGHIILTGLGRKSRVYLGQHYYTWEEKMLIDLRQRFPGRKIIYRPKPNSPPVKLNCPMEAKMPIEKLLEGASLVVSRHSNVCVDGVIANVPFEAEDGAAMWLRGKPWSIENRIAFLRKLSWWQWQVKEAKEAWDFLHEYCDRYPIEGAIHENSHGMWQAGLRRMVQH